MNYQVYLGMLTISQTAEDIQKILNVIDQDHQDEIQDVMDDFNYAGSPCHYWLWLGLLKCSLLVRSSMKKWLLVIHRTLVLLLLLVIPMQLLSESMPKWAIEDENVNDMIVDIMIDELHKLSEIIDIPIIISHTN